MAFKARKPTTELVPGDVYITFYKGTGVFMVIGNHPDERNNEIKIIDVITLWRFYAENGQLEACRLFNFRAYESEQVELLWSAKRVRK